VVNTSTRELLFQCFTIKIQLSVLIFFIRRWKFCQQIQNLMVKFSEYIMHMKSRNKWKSTNCRKFPNCVCPSKLVNYFGKNLDLRISVLFIPPLHRRGVYCFTFVRPSVRPSFRPSKIFFVAFFSATIDGRNLIFGHKLNIGMPYCGKRFWTRQIPTSCFPT